MLFGSESSNNGEFLPERTWKLVRIKEIIELQRFELSEVIYENFMANVVGAKILARIKEIIESWEVKLQRVNCITTPLTTPLTYEVAKNVQKEERNNKYKNFFRDILLNIFQDLFKNISRKFKETFLHQRHDIFNASLIFKEAVQEPQLIFDLGCKSKPVTSSRLTI